MKHAAQRGLYLDVTRVYDLGADAFDPDKFVREAVEDGDLYAAATIALESYGWHLYNFIARQVQPDEVDEVFARVADEMLRGLPELTARARVRDWIFTLVHGAWIRTQAGDPQVPLEHAPAFARWVQQMSAGFRSAVGLEKRVRRVKGSEGIGGGGQPLVVTGAGGGPKPIPTPEPMSDGLPRQLHAIGTSPINFGRTPQRTGIQRVAMQRIR